MSPTKTSNEKITQVLQGTKDVLLESGWTKFTSYEPRTGHYCVNGALAKACGYDVEQIIDEFTTEIVDDPTWWDSALVVANAVRRYLNFGPDYSKEYPPALSAAFNDSESTSFNDVISVIDDAILEVKERELELA